LILVTGANGHLGGAILTILEDRGSVVVGSSRSGSGSLRTIDFDAPGGVSFEGVDTLVLVSAGEAEDDVVVARHQAAITAAERDRVGHIVYTSLTTAGDHLAFALAHRWTERRLQESDVSWTILRNGLYAELFGSLLGWSGTTLTSAFGAGELAAATRGDLAEAAAVIAQSPGQHAGRIYDLVGHPITAAQVAARLGVPLQTVPLAERRTQLENAGMKPFQPAMLMSIHSGVRHDFLAGTTDDLRTLLGREPSDALAAAAEAARLAAPAELRLSTVA
jgi:NAD(P)H dehydrogenase (quinone)